MQPTKLFRIIFSPWRKYNEFFDKGSWGIWGFSPILKYTILYFFVFILATLLGVVKLDPNTTATSIYFGIFILGFIAIALIWFIYLPILALIVLFRTLKKIKNSVNQLISYFKESPWEMTPKRLYTQPNWAFMLRVIHIKDFLLDVFDWAAQYYPLSLLSTSQVRYPISIRIRYLSRLFESRIAELNIPLKFDGYEINMQNTLYKFVLYEEVKDFAKMVKKLKKGFRHNYGFYIAEENGQINIIIPHAQ